MASTLVSDFSNLDLTHTTKKIIAETLRGPVTEPSKLPKWSYDGSSTGQAPGEDSEVILCPQAISKNPFRRGNNILVMCDTYTPARQRNF